MPYGNKIINIVANKCVNCKFYKPNKTHTSLGICYLNKELNGYFYHNHFNYAEIMRSKHGLCGDEGKFFKPIKKE